MSWQVMSLVASVFMAAYIGLNDYYKINGLAMVFWRSLFTAVVTVPFLVFCPLPSSAAFFWGAAFIGVCGTISDSLAFNAAAKFGGAVVSRLVYLNVWLTFPVWFLLDPTGFAALWSHQPIFYGIVACLVVAVATMFFLKKDKVSFAALIFVAPTIIIFAVNDLVNKYILVGQSGIIVAVQFIAIMALAMTGTSFLIKCVRPRLCPVLVERKTLVAGFWGGVIFLGLLILKNLVMLEIPNPAYLGAILTLSAVWLYGINRLRRVDDHSNAKAGFVLLFSTIVLMILTSLI